MARIVTTDLFEEIIEENKRLLSELKSSEKCVKLLQNYRKCLINLSESCKCDPIVNNKYVISLLETQYKALFTHEVEVTVTQNEQVLPMFQLIDMEPDIVEVIEQTIPIPETSIAIDLTEDTTDLDQIQLRCNTSGEMTPLLATESLIASKNRNVPAQRRPKAPRRNYVVFKKILPKGGSIKPKKLFKCSYSGCEDIFNSLKTLKTHEMNHIKDVYPRAQVSDKPKERMRRRFDWNDSSQKPQIRKMIRESANESERNRRRRFNDLVGDLIKEVPQLISLDRRPPNRQILDEAIKYIKFLEKSQKSLTKEFDREQKINQNYEETLESALTSGVKPEPTYY